ncbi:MAG: hemin receptor [Ideonella sp.]|nr:hemin receptor [Ideonella sp.]
MTPRQRQHVQQSFALVAPIATQAAAIFYEQLFERDPDLRRLFRGDMAAQGERLMAMIGGAVQLLGQPARLDATLQALGRRHAGYGVRASHYDTVGAALLDTLAIGLGTQFTPEVRAAWTALYAHISLTMQSAAADVSAEPIAATV